MRHFSTGVTFQGVVFATFGGYDMFSTDRRKLTPNHFSTSKMTGVAFRREPLIVVTPASMGIMQ